MINTLIEKIKGKGTRIVFTEGSDPRILEAAIRLHKENIVVPVLLGNRAEIAGSAAANGWDIEGIETLDPIEYKNMDMMVTKVIELRKGKLDEAQAREACLHRNFFGTMYVKLGCADGLLGGATYSTADTVRPALQLIKTRPGNSIVSSCFILMKEIWLWETAPSISTQVQMIWLKSLCRLLIPYVSSALSQESDCCPTPHWAPQRVPALRR